MIRNVTTQRVVRALLEHWWVNVSIGILFLAGAVLLLDLPAQVLRGEKGQLAIQALDAMRRPFLAIKEIEVKAINGAGSEMIMRDYQNAAAAGYKALVSYQNLARYNDELTMKVATLAQKYDAWMTAERNYLEQLVGTTGTTMPAMEKRLHKLMSGVSAHFLRTMEVLGDGEGPIHFDIDRGRRAIRISMFLFGMLFLYFAAILFYQQFRKAHNLELQVAERSSHLVEINKKLAQEVAQRKQVEEEIRHQASHDTLTGLPNRWLFLDRLDQALARAPWRRNLAVVLFVDLDGFKQVNDAFGHAVGDELLRDVVERLRDCVRDGDTVARFGGDEFTIALVDVHDKEDIYPIVQKIIEAVGRPFVLSGREVVVSCSIGISLYPGDGENAESLLKSSDAAMYGAKNRGKNCWQFYSELADSKTET